MVTPARRSSRRGEPPHERGSLEVWRCGASPWRPYETRWPSTGGLGKPLGPRSVGGAAQSTAKVCVEGRTAPNGPFVWRMGRVGARGEEAFSGLGRRPRRVATCGAVGTASAVVR